jgi:hypothetical protein
VGVLRSAKPSRNTPIFPHLLRRHQLSILPDSIVFAKCNEYP